MAEFDAYSAPWSTPKVPRTFSTPTGYPGQVSGGLGLTGETSPFPPLLLGRSLSHGLPLGDASLGLPASINALFQPGVFQFQCDPPDLPKAQLEPQRQASEPVAAPKQKASPAPSGQLPVPSQPSADQRAKSTRPQLCERILQSSCVFCQVQRSRLSGHEDVAVEQQNLRLLHSQREKLH
eukprot:Skav219252  [mRNA]  locus=scaffold1242:310551:313192:+ [translate_table: standard]